MGQEVPGIFINSSGQGLAGSRDPLRQLREAGVGVGWGGLSPGCCPCDGEARDSQKLLSKACLSDAYSQPPFPFSLQPAPSCPCSLASAADRAGSGPGLAQR